MRTLTKIAVAALALTAPLLASAAAPAVPAGVKNIVVVHGAFVDGSGWRVVHDTLHLKGYKVTVVQEPLTTLDADVAATRNAIDAQDGPVVLVADGYGGAVISAAGAQSKVKALVYVAALQPDVGESVAQLEAPYPQPATMSTRRKTAISSSIQPNSAPILPATSSPIEPTSWLIRKCRRPRPHTALPPRLPHGTTSLAMPSWQRMTAS